MFEEEKNYNTESDYQKTTSTTKSNIDFQLIALGFYIASGILIIVGFVFMFHYGDGIESTFGHVVDGDAYNFIIMGLRGLGFITTGLISAVVGSALLICEYVQNSGGK